MFVVFQLSATSPETIEAGGLSKFSLINSCGLALVHGKDRVEHVGYTLFRLAHAGRPGWGCPATAP